MLDLGNLIVLFYWLCCCCCCVFPGAIEMRQLDINRARLAEMLSYMDTIARPCDNFYQYACGNWPRQHNSEGQLEYGNTLDLLDYELNRKLEQLLKKPANESDNDAEAQSVYRKVRTYYKSCKKVKPYNLKKYLLLVQPGLESSWCLLQRHGARHWNASKFDWLETVAKLRLYGLNGVLLKELVMPHWDDSSRNSIYLDKPNLSETQPMDEGLMIELLLDIGQTKREANHLARNISAFEQQLHKLHELEDDEGTKEMQLSYLQQFLPEIDWLAYIRQLKGLETSLNTTVVIQNVPYMRELVRLLRCTEPETICHYIMLKFLLFLKLQGPAEISKQECIASLRRAMPLAMSHLVGTHFYSDAEENDELLQQMFSELQNKFRQTLSDNRLQLPRPIVSALLEKLSAMLLQVGYAPRNASAEFYEEYYERVELDHNFYANQLSLLRLNVEKAHESPDMSVWPTNDTSVADSLADWPRSSSSLFYIKPRNTIIVPYGFLQMPVYQRQLAPIFKYAVLGFHMAHELLHGFDSAGIDYDAVGNLMGPSEEIAANQRFIHGLRCMQNELATGSRSLNEKLADYEGLRLAYETYFHGNVSREQQTTESFSTYVLLQQHTEQQLFFISFAQFFCGKPHTKPGGRSSFLEHAVDEFRVLQTLANFEPFAKEFKCERRSKMQTKTRCRLW